MNYPILGCGAIGAALRSQGATWPWRLMAVSTCGSTELLLKRWLQEGNHYPCAVVARQQRHGRGQWGRSWCAPAGGVWLSAAWTLPKAVAMGLQTEGLGLALALALMEWLEHLGLKVALKWPNDILVEQRKLAGLLVHRQLRRGVPQKLGLGLGLNLSNPVPHGAIALGELLATRTPSLPQAQAAALLACERAMVLLEKPEAVVQGCQARLWLPPQELVTSTGCGAHVVGLTPGGDLRLQRQDGHIDVVGNGTWRLPGPTSQPPTMGSHGVV